MSYKITITNDLVCDHCGKVYENIYRSSNETLLNKAIKDNWIMDNNGKVYCPDCKDKTITLQIKFRWPNYYRMSAVEQHCENSGRNNPIKSVFEKDNELHIWVDLDKAPKFAQLDSNSIASLISSDWEKTISYINIIYSEHEIKYSNLLFVNAIEVNKITEFIFTFADKKEKIY